MKRIPAITLTLVMLLAALTGCVASQNPEISQNKLLREENVKRVSVTSEPNGYEYSFSGDNVKAVTDYLSNLHLAADFKDNPNGYVGMTLVVSLEYDNGTSSTIYHFGNMFIRADNGPWYKMDYDEASRFHPLLQELSSSTAGGGDSQDNEYLVSHIQIKSGNNTIQPFGSLLWSRTDHGDGTFDEIHADRPDIPDVINRYANDIPVLVLEKRVSYLVQMNGRVEDVHLFTPSGDGYTKTETTFDALSSLADGTYYVAFEVLLSGNCDSDAPQNSCRYEDVFCLVVGEQNDDFYDHVPYEAMLNLEIMDGKLRFQRIATTPCIVYSNTPIAEMTKGTMYDGRHDILTSIFQATDGKDAIMDTSECIFSHYIYMFDNEREDIPWHYRFAICNCGAVMITNNNELICTIRLAAEEIQSILDLFGPTDTEKLSGAVDEG